MPPEVFQWCLSILMEVCISKHQVVALVPVVVYIGLAPKIYTLCITFTFS